MRPEPLTPEQARDPHEAWSNGWSNGFASAREVTDEMVDRAALALCGIAHGTPVASWDEALDGAADHFRPRARAALAAAFQDTRQPQEGS